MLSNWRVLLWVCAVALTVMEVHPGQARSPDAYFQAVSRLSMFCGAPNDRVLRDQLCGTARGALERQVGHDVAPGPAGFSDPSTITVLVNGYEVQGPNGPLLAITVDLYRKGVVDTRLYGVAPIVVEAPSTETEWQDLAARFEKTLNENVVRPWRAATGRSSAKAE